jgi:hypothetical protein
LILVVLVCLTLLPQPAAAREVGAFEPYSHAELAQMLAPVALYPDALLAQVLMAATYPIEVVEAERWINANRHLHDDALDAALLRMDWDPSIKALCHFPDLLQLMSERIGETTELGNAFLVQEEEVMAMVQELRAEARDAGHLTSSAQQRVVVIENETIIIRPTNPRVIYVPYYDPLLVYGSWWYPAYPPTYWGPAGVRVSYGISYWSGLSFSFSFGSLSYFDWPRRVIVVDARSRPKYVRPAHWARTAGTWRHAPSHRHGVAYRDHATARKYTDKSHRDPRYRDDKGGPAVYRQKDPTHRGHPGSVTGTPRGSEQRNRMESDRSLRQRPESRRPDYQVRSEQSHQKPFATSDRRQIQRNTAAHQPRRSTDRQTERAKGVDTTWQKNRVNSNRQPAVGKERQKQVAPAVPQRQPKTEGQQDRSRHLATGQPPQQHSRDTKISAAAKHQRVSQQPAAARDDTGSPEQKRGFQGRW